MASMTTSKVIINEKLKKDMIQKICSIIEEKLFRGKGNIRMVRIRQNVAHAMNALLGKSIVQSKIDLYCQSYAASHIQAVARVGEAVGTIAAQSLNQPVTQAVLKSQHRTGNKESAGANSLISLNKMSVSQRTFKVHLKPAAASRFQILAGAEVGILKELARRFEEVKLEDVLSSTYGDSKYSPVTVNRNWYPDENSGDLAPDYEDYSQDPLYFYINHHRMGPDQVVYRFRMDPSKLEDAGLKQLDVYNVLIHIEGIMVVIHPPSSFTFDLVPGNKPLTSFLTFITTLMKTQLKGIKGLSSISERKISVSQLVRQRYTEIDETGKEMTYLYLNPISMAHFPVEILKRHIEERNDGLLPMKEITRLYHDSGSEGSGSSYDLFHLVYEGKPVINEDFVYSYFLFTGTLTVQELLTHKFTEKLQFSSLCDLDYLISNDPNEMISLIGKTGARTIHEYNYSEELMAGETPLSYQHITTVCRRMFGLRLNPITPPSYMKDKEPNALDKLGYQNYRQNLEREIIKGKRSTTNDLPSAVMVGKRPKLGTGAIETVVDNERRQQVIALYSEARQAQQYLSEYDDISFPKLGEVKPLTSMTFRPFTREGFKLPGKDYQGE